MTLTEMLNTLFPTGPLVEAPTDEQLAVLQHPSGPAWVLAGPGTGKTQSLALLVLRLLYVENDESQEQRVPPSSIFVTTFTDKAAINLQDRISRFRRILEQHHPSVRGVDVSDLRIRTLDSACNDILQRKRADNYSNVRLMDRFEQYLFVYENLSIVREDTSQDHAFWAHFHYLIQQRDWQPNRSSRWTGGLRLPPKWARASALVQLFDRIAQDTVSVDFLRTSNSAHGRLADLYDEYRSALNAHHRCDFAHLQARFAEFLESPIGQGYVKGGPGHLPIKWVIVDEYQDTNPLQESIYLRLAGSSPHNLVVVGDDDQALYRFRGASVECMVTFGEACIRAFDLNERRVATYPLSGNFRSHPAIVDFCEGYITAFPVMNKPGARARGKNPLQHKSNINGSYHAVGTMTCNKVAETAARYATAVRELVDANVVEDASQCCLLLTSTKEGKLGAGPYVEALRERGLVPYNPRSKSFLEREEVRTMLGALIRIIDPKGDWLPDWPPDLVELLGSCHDAVETAVEANIDLKTYLVECNENLAQHPNSFVPASLQEIVYLLLSRNPFNAWQRDRISRVRLARVTALIESYAAMPVPGQPNISRGQLKSAVDGTGGVVSGWCRQFYHRFFGYLQRAGLDEEEQDDVLVPLGTVPVMTIHQAKGLEFPFVFVGHLSKAATPGPAHRLETELGRFSLRKETKGPLLSDEERANLDLIRQYYVAYSRAQWALIMVGLRSHLKKGQIPCGPSKNWLTHRVVPL
jgi:DNA helicase-2/ATP-dependent DNA helicase PcrA